MDLARQIEALRNQRNKIRNKSILTDVNNQYKMRQDITIQNCHKTHNFSSYNHNQQNLQRVDICSAKALANSHSVTKSQVSLQDALIYIKHLQKSNSGLRQELNQNKIYYQNKISKLQSKVKEKNKLLDQCQRQIGHIKKQYMLIDTCKKGQGLSKGRQSSIKDQYSDKSGLILEDSSCQSGNIEMTMAQIKKNIKEATLVQPSHGLIRKNTQ